MVRTILGEPSWKSIFARKYALSKEVIIPHTTTTFDKPFLIESGQDYDIEHNLSPTDVTNYFSGAPITLTLADSWTCCDTRCDKGWLFSG